MVDDTKKYICTSCPSELSKIRQWVRFACRQYGIAAEQTNNIVLAVDEACVNVIRHGYLNATDGYLCIETYSRDGFGVFVIKDKCAQIDSEVIEPKASESLKPGGEGLHLIHQIMDSVTVMPMEEGGNQLELKIRL